MFLKSKESNTSSPLRKSLRCRKNRVFLTTLLCSGFLLAATSRPRLYPTSVEGYGDLLDDTSIYDPQYDLSQILNRSPPGAEETSDNRNYRWLTRESRMMHKYLDGLKGVEIGASTHSGFGLKTVNIDYTADETMFTREQIKYTGHYRRVDIVASGDKLPFKNNVVDFVVSSHAIEHFYDPIATVCEWLRIVKVGGYVAAVVPHKRRTFDRNKPRTTLKELIVRHRTPIDPKDDDHQHWNIWITKDFLEMLNYMGLKIVDHQNWDDKFGNGFAAIVQKTTESSSDKC